MVLSDFESPARVGLLIGQILVGGTFLSSATAKFLNSADFTNAMRLSGLPSRWVGPFAGSVITVEVLLAIGLWEGSAYLLQISALVAATMLLAFTGWMIWALSRGLVISCGCFGSTQEQIGMKSIARNLALMATSIGTLALGSRVASLLPTPSLSLLLVVVGVALIYALAYAFWTARPSLFLTIADVMES